MKSIIHISDLHFGCENKTMIEILTETLNSLSPDLVIITGDVTQRARRSQFKAAQQFLHQLTAKTLLVPGNHDIPLYDLFSRVFRPYEKYKQYISNSLETSFLDEEIAILGLNSTTPFRAKNGEISEEQLSKISTFFAHRPDAVKIVMMHHNLIHIKKFHHPVANHKEVIQKLFESNVDIVLSGHLHFPYLQLLENKKSRMYLITAGTATSTRIREGDNSFNVIKIAKAGFSIDIYHFNGNIFNISKSQNFHFARLNSKRESSR